MGLSASKRFSLSCLSEDAGFLQPIDNDKIPNKINSKYFTDTPDNDFKIY